MTALWLPMVGMSTHTISCYGHCLMYMMYTLSCDRMAYLNLGSGRSNFFASELTILWSQNMLIRSTRENDIIVAVSSKTSCTKCTYQRPYVHNVHMLPVAGVLLVVLLVAF